MRVSDYIHLCLFDPEHGYYRSRPAIGRRGDFITAPEISQTFGELIGLWSVAVWQQMGAPAAFHLIEYGAGRGTLMRDALRAARIVPQFMEAAKISLCDINPVLREQQEQALGGLGLPAGKVRFVEGMDDDDLYQANLANEPAIIIANEFLDVWPVRQYIRKQDGWIGRWVGLDENGQLQFVPPRTHDGLGEPASLSPSDIDSRFGHAAEGDIVTVTHYGFADELLGPWQRFAALFIDYGHVAAEIGDTLQAVRNHAYEHPLTSPGEADLTHQVDFQDFAGRVKGHSPNHRIDGPITQAEFLGRLGIMERASRLMAANPDQAAQLEAGIVRLMSPQGMGGRFKAIAVRSQDLPVTPGFE
ncbi:MAG: SAM-dependent methyltransferase [Alphaproteobacteria bacterium]|nr:SAM-dependent methyltransferase [Alphaproteobacteria bacterium]